MLNAFCKLPLFSKFYSIKWQLTFSKSLSFQDMSLITSFPDCHNLFKNFIPVQGACCGDKLQELHSVSSVCH